MDQSAIGSYIAQKRRAQNRTQEQLAEQLGVSNKTVSKWENGRRCWRASGSPGSGCSRSDPFPSAPEGDGIRIHTA